MTTARELLAALDEYVDTSVEDARAAAKELSKILGAFVKEGELSDTIFDGIDGLNFPMVVYTNGKDRNYYERKPLLKLNVEMARKFGDQIKQHGKVDLDKDEIVVGSFKLARVGLCKDAPVYHVMKKR